jgi:hypothetical protein
LSVGLIRTWEEEGEEEDYNRRIYYNRFSISRCYEKRTTRNSHRQRKEHKLN